MIIQRIIGGLGNQMFQYAAAKSLSLQKDIQLKLDISNTHKERPFELDIFNVREEFATRNELEDFGLYVKKFSRPYFKGKINSILSSYNQRVYEEPHFNFDPIFFKTANKIYLKGYWQSDKYFKKFEKEIRAIYKFPSEAVAKYKDLIDYIKSTVSVSIHLRLGDYINNTETLKFHGICSMDYYNEAIASLIDRFGEIKVFVFSNDTELANKMLKINYSFELIQSSMYTYEDMYLMSNCKHNVIANSSYSWWAAWLNNNPEKNIIAPKKWFNNANLDTKDLIPSSWIKI